MTNKTLFFSLASCFFALTDSIYSQDDLVDATYSTEFRLGPLSADDIASIPEPGMKSTGLANPSFVQSDYGTRVYRVSIASDFTNASRVRHNYSRRQAFNADNTRLISNSSNGYWLLYDANNFQKLDRSGFGGSLTGMAGDCEPIWNPIDANRLWYTDTHGGLIWFEKDVTTDVDTVAFDFTGRLPWPAADRVWTKSEGTCSADGRYFAFLATRYDSQAQQNVIYGIFSYDRINDQIVGTLDASEFDGHFPDHVSVSASGNYVVPSWPFLPNYGTRAYPLDFSSFSQLHTASTHSDLAFGPNGEDYYVLADFQTGVIRAVNIASGDSFDLTDIYQSASSAYSIHISGQAFDKPGWVTISTYNDSENNGATKPATTLREQYRKVFLAELKPGGQLLNVAHTQTADNFGGYFGEPQATINRAGTRIIWASNFDSGGQPSDYLATIPTWAYQSMTPVYPFSRKLLDGVVADGQLSDLEQTDNEYLNLLPSPTNNPTKQIVEMILLGESDDTDLTSLSFDLEAKMQGGPSGDVVQSVTFFQYTTGTWVTLDSRAVANPDIAIRVSVETNASDFVHPITGEMLARVKWQSPEFSNVPFVWDIDIDQAVWRTVTE